MKPNDTIDKDLPAVPSPADTAIDAKEETPAVPLEGIEDAHTGAVEKETLIEEVKISETNGTEAEKTAVIEQTIESADSASPALDKPAPFGKYSRQGSRSFITPDKQASPDTGKTEAGLKKKKRKISMMRTADGKPVTKIGAPAQNAPKPSQNEAPVQKPSKAQMKKAKAKIQSEAAEVKAENQEEKKKKSFSDSFNAFLTNKSASLAAWICIVLMTCVLVFLAVRLSNTSNEAVTLKGANTSLNQQLAEMQATVDSNNAAISSMNSQIEELENGPDKMLTDIKVLMGEEDYEAAMDAADELSSAYPGTPQAAEAKELKERCEKTMDDDRVDDAKSSESLQKEMGTPFE